MFHLVNTVQGREPRGAEALERAAARRHQAEAAGEGKPSYACLRSGSRAQIYSCQILQTFF